MGGAQTCTTSLQGRAEAEAVGEGGDKGADLRLGRMQTGNLAQGCRPAVVTNLQGRVYAEAVREGGDKKAVGLGTTPAAGDCSMGKPSGL